MVNIYFIHRFPFNKDAFIRDEFEQLTAKGFTVRYLDVSHLLKKKKLEANLPPDLEKFVINFTTRKSFANFLMKNHKNAIIITDVGLLLNSAWMFLAIFKTGIPYIMFESAAFPELKLKKGLNSSQLKLKRAIARFNLKKLYHKPLESVTYFLAKWQLQPALMLIKSSHRVTSEKLQLCGKTTTVIQTTSPDYIMAKQIKEPLQVKKPYAVFIDQYFVHHPDFLTNHIIHSFSANQYYGELNNFLSQYSKQTGLNIIIASHPRRNEKQRADFIPEFELVYNKTAELVKNAEIVFLHFSTAINFAIVFNKPFVLLGSDLFENSHIKHKIESFARYFDKKTINMSLYKTSIMPLNIVQHDIPEEKYKTYLETYLKYPDASETTLADQIENAIKQAKLL